MEGLSNLFRGNGYTTINGAQLKHILNDSNIVILDVRNPGEYRNGHIPKAINIPINEIQGRLSEISLYRNSAILVYCASGSRSIKAAYFLSRNGFKKIYNLSRGISSYKGTLSKM